MTISMLVLVIAIVALILTGIFGFGLRRVDNWLVSFLQNFAGALFIFSGWVKAVDPLGTAYKMEQYFGEFEATIAGTKMAGLASVFPWMAEYAIAFSVFMIVLEIVVGVMLILGYFREATSWIFLLTIVFFTILTGFTYLTGYVPGDVNFFQFSQWEGYVDTNMKVTDCGCFGDFIKLEPRTSFFKDIFLLIPSLIFVFWHKKMHQLFNSGTRTAITLITLAGLIVYCFSNYVWDLPHADFRPFREDVNVAERLQLEKEAQENIQIIAFKLTNIESGQVVELPYDQYLKEFKNYPKTEWESEQIQSEPTVPKTKISDFEVADMEGNNATDEILGYPEYQFMIVAYKLYGTESSSVVTVNDTLWAVDTVLVADTLKYVQSVEDIQKRQIEVPVYNWDAEHLAPWLGVVNPVLDEAISEGVRVIGVTAYTSSPRADDFRAASKSNYPFYGADDILLKTIVRSNPGVVLMKDGLIIKKWHYKKLPSYAEIKQAYMN